MNKNRNRLLEYREQTDSCQVGGAGGLDGKGEEFRNTDGQL